MQLTSIFLFSTVCIVLSLEMFGYINRLNNKILQFDWTCSTHMVNDASILFNNVLIESVKVYIPSKTILVREDDTP